MRHSHLINFFGMKRLWVILFVIVSWVTAQEYSPHKIYIYEDGKKISRGRDWFGGKYFGEMVGSPSYYTLQGYGIIIKEPNKNYIYNTNVEAGEHSVPTVNEWIRQGQSVDGLYRPLDLQSVIDYLATKYPDYNWAENIYKEIGTTKVSPPIIKKGTQYYYWKPKEGEIYSGDGGKRLAREDIRFDKNNKPPSLPPSNLVDIIEDIKDGLNYTSTNVKKVKEKTKPSTTWPRGKYMSASEKPLNYSAPIVSAPKNDFTQIPPPLETLTNIAVVDFNGNNILDGEVKALTDRLRVELFKTKHFKVIEREMMQEVMKEQGFQQSGCTTDECMVQIGKLIGVEKIIGGNISKVGNIYSVTSRIVSVETGEIEKTEIFDHTGDIGQLLTNGMRMVAIGLTK